MKSIFSFLSLLGMVVLWGNHEGFFSDFILEDLKEDPANIFINACRQGDVESVQMMLEEDLVTLGVRDESGNPSLFVAVESNPDGKELLTTLLEYSEEEDRIGKNGRGESFLFYMVRLTNEGKVSFRLLKSYLKYLWGDELELEDDNGNKMLHLLFQQELTARTRRICKLLMEYGGNSSERNNLGETAYTLALKAFTRSKMSFLETMLIFRELSCSYSFYLDREEEPFAGMVESINSELERQKLLDADIFDLFRNFEIRLY